MKFVLFFCACFAFTAALPGVDDLEQFMVGSEPAEPGQFPYSVALIIHNDRANSWCGGSLISDLYVLTAAQCTYKVPSCIAILNAHNISNPLETGQMRVFTEKLYTHIGWNPATTQNDIGLVELPESVTFSKSLQPVRLPSWRHQTQLYVGQLATMVGWGTTGSSNQLSQILRYIKNPIITNLSCLVYYPAWIWPTHICMAGDNQVGPCNGDVGSPMTIVENDGERTQIGVASWISSWGCKTSRPSANTRVTDYLGWIEDNSNVIIRH